MVGGEQGEQPQLGHGKRRCPDELAAEVVELGAELVGLVGKGAEVGPPPQQVVDLANDRLGSGHVGECEVGPDQLQPGLDRVV